jgi:hypothetical protein
MVAGLPWAVLSAVVRSEIWNLYGPDGAAVLPYVSASLALAVEMEVLQYAILGLFLGVIFVVVGDRIPAKGTIGKTIIFLSTVWSVLLLVAWLIVVVAYIVPGRFAYPSEHQLEAYLLSLLAGLGVYSLWGATFGYILSRPWLVERMKFSST